MGRIVIASVLVALTVGCDTLHGVRRSTTLSGSVFHTEVLAAVERVPEVTDVTHRTHPGRDVRTLYGKRHEPAVEQISYRSTKSLGGVIELRVQPDGNTDLQMYCLGFAQMSDAKIENIRKTMDVVYSELETTITNFPPSNAVEETILK